MFSAYMLESYWSDIFRFMHHNQNQTTCVDNVYILFTHDPWWCCLVTMFLYKVCVYPCVKNKLPTILKRLGTYLFLLMIVTIVYAFTGYYYRYSVWPKIAHTWLLNILFSLVSMAVAEFVHAQSPYNMRGLLSGMHYVLLVASPIMGAWVNGFTNCSSEHCLIILHSIGGGLNIAGFLLYLVVAGRYKRRVRDEEYFPYVHIEAIYDRYLSQAESARPR